jgi:hypothetical protein
LPDALPPHINGKERTGRDKHRVMRPQAAPLAVKLQQPLTAGDPDQHMHRPVMTKLHAPVLPLRQLRQRQQFDRVLCHCMTLSAKDK